MASADVSMYDVVNLAPVVAAVQRHAHIRWVDADNNLYAGTLRRFAGNVSDVYLTRIDITTDSGWETDMPLMYASQLHSNGELAIDS